MSKREGITRLAKVVRGIGWLIIFSSGAIMLSNKGLDGDSAMSGIIITAVLAVPCFAVAWIVEGFAK